MAIIITAAMLRQAAADNSRKPARDCWSNLILRNGRYAKRVKRDGVEASELRDERPKRTQEFGSELPVCRKHGAKGSTKTLPGKGSYARDFQTAYRDMQIKLGNVKAVVVKRVQPAMQVIADSAAAELIKRMLTPAS